MSIPHFLHGLWFSFRPFVRGLMFYYGLDFHDLAPNSFLHISAFIVMCEAFLRIPPHFRLWLKTFNVKPKVVSGQHAECGGAMVSKMSNVSWPKGTFGPCDVGHLTHHGASAFCMLATHHLRLHIKDL